MKNKKRLEKVEMELAEQEINLGLDNNSQKAGLEKTMRHIANTVKKEGLQ